MGGCALLQGIFLTQGLNPRLLCLLYWQAGSSPLSHCGSEMYEGTASQTWPISQGRTALLRERKQLWRALHGAQLPAWRGPPGCLVGRGTEWSPAASSVRRQSWKARAAPCNASCQVQALRNRSNVQKVPVWNSKFQVAGGSQQVLSL